jgi:putative addiction module component (TIGR02574 family)
MGALQEMAMVSATIDELEAAVLQLPPSDRVHLVERLLSSLDDEDEVLAAWLEEAERRADALDRGESQAVPVEDVIAHARAKLRP